MATIAISPGANFDFSWLNQVVARHDLTQMEIESFSLSHNSPTLQCLSTEIDLRYSRGLLYCNPTKPHKRWGNRYHIYVCFNTVIRGGASPYAMIRRIFRRCRCLCSKATSVFQEQEALWAELFVEFDGAAVDILPSLQICIWSTEFHNDGSLRISWAVHAWGICVWILLQ